MNPRRRGEIAGGLQRDPRSNGGRRPDGLDEREYRALKRGVKAHVFASFGRNLSEEDLEDVVHEAWVAALASAERGEQVRHLGAYLRRVAWREAHAIAARRDRASVSIEALNGSGDEVLRSRTEHSPEERCASRARLARAVEALEQLTPQERAAYRARFVERLRSAEACRRLGISRTVYFERVHRASEHVRSAVWAESSRFDDLQRALLNAYVEGRTSGSVRRRAERLIASDADAAVLARELRRFHEDAASALPILGADQALDVGIVERLGAIGARVKETIVGAAARGEAETASSGALASGGTRGGGTAAAGGVAGALGLGGGAAQLAAVCGGVATVACVAAIAPGGGLRAVSEEEKKPAAERAARAKKAQPAVAATAAPAVYPSQVGNEAPAAVAAEPAPTPAPTPERTGGGGEQAPAPAPSEPVPVEEAPASDFTYGTESSSAAPAPAPSGSTSSGGGGGNSGGGGSAPEGGDFAFGQ